MCIRMAFGSALLLWLLGCSSGDDFPQSFHREALKAEGRNKPIVQVSSVTHFAWERLFIFGPYTPVDRIQSQLGFQWPEAERTGISASDTFYLFVFVKDGEVVHHFKYPRELGDFQNLGARAFFSPGDDTFEVKRSASVARANRLHFYAQRQETTPQRGHPLEVPVKTQSSHPDR